MNAHRLALFTLVLVALVGTCLLTSDTYRPNMKRQPKHLLKDASEEKLVDHTIYFYNITDRRDAMPYMRIIFGAIPASRTEPMDRLRKRIDEKIVAAGGVYQAADYGKINSVITEHVKEMIGSGARLVAIEFPRERKGILLYQKK